MTGCSLLFDASSIRLYSGFEFLPGAARDDAARGDRDLLAGLRIPAWPLVLVAQIEVPETRQFHLLASFQGGTDLLEERFHQFLGFPLVESQILEQALGHFGFRQCHRIISS